MSKNMPVSSPLPNNKNIGGNHFAKISSIYTLQEENLK